MTFTRLTSTEFDALRTDYSVGASGHAEIHNIANSGLRTLSDCIRAGVMPVTAPDFGADATGTTDSTAAIQDAIDSHGDVYIPAGTYRFSALTIPASTRIQAHPRAILHLYGNGSDPAILLTGSRVRVKGLRMLGVSGSAPAGILSEGGANDIRLEDVEINGAWCLTEGAVVISGDNAYWNFVGGDYAEAYGHILDLRSAAVAFNFWGGHFHFTDGFVINQRGGGNTNPLALQMTGTVMEGGISGQMYAASLHGSVFAQCHFENSASATCIPIVIGGSGNDGGQCMGVDFIACNINAERAPYCISFEGQGVSRAVSVRSCRMSGQSGYLTAAINAKRVWESSFMGNRVVPNGSTHVLMTGDGYSAQNIVVQDETTFGVHNLP